MVTKRLTLEEAAPCVKLIFGSDLGKKYYPTEEFGNTRNIILLPDNLLRRSNSALT